MFHFINGLVQLDYAPIGQVKYCNNLELENIIKNIAGLFCDDLINWICGTMIRDIYLEIEKNADQRKMIWDNLTDAERETLVNDLSSKNAKINNQFIGY